MTETLLREVIQLRQNHLRAVRLEDDLSNGNLLTGYTLTAQALAALGRVVDGLAGNARAWILTGPYGSGKSFFGLFLAHLLDARQIGHTIAWDMLERSDPLLTERLQEQIGGNDGFVTVAVTGARAPLQECLARGFEQALESGMFAPALRESLAEARQADSRVFLHWVEAFLAAVSQTPAGARGALILFDELGKALEHAATHPYESDVYLLQELAEFAARSGERPLVFAGILHQAFEQYAVLLDSAAQREWAKVQGRFEDIPFQEPPVQQMRLLARALNDAADSPALTPAFGETMQAVEAAGWRPATMNASEFTDLVCRAYPLHPSVFVALPYFFRRLAQNERSIFAYLASQEPFGFQEFLASHTSGEFLRLPDLFDYLAANYRGRIYASGRARPLTEALERLENTPNLGPIETDLLKTISLLNWLGEIGPLQATEAMILSAFHTPDWNESALRAGLKALQRRSLIVYRRFNDTYAVWQGSDVDIEERLHTARAALGMTFSIAEVLQGYLPPRPLLARRHSYQTGTQRYFDVHYVDSHNRDKVSLSPSPEASGLVLLCLPGTLAEVEQFVQWAQSETPQSSPEIVIGVAGRAIRLTELVQELRGLHWVRENTPALRDDPVARREWRTRLAAIERLIRMELDEAINLHRISALASCQWFYQGVKVSKQVQRGLSALLSEVCDTLYPASPRVWNELLNRRALTSQGAAARRTLIEGILTRADQPIFGIQKFPPERSMYEALLRRGEMHRYDNGRWFISPPGENDLHLTAAWQAIYDFVFTELPEPRPVPDLYAHLSAPPFGITEGVMPVMLAVFYKVYENEMTLYKEGTLLVEPSVADWEVLLRRPELFSLAGCRVTGLRAAVLKRMARGLRVPTYVMPVTRAVIGRLKALPDHAWRTRRLPESALNLRHAVDTARSPERFLFVEVPEALGLLAFEEGEFGQERFEAFFARLNEALDALANVTPNLLIWARDTWLTACGLPDDEAGWESFCQLAEQLAPRVTHPTLLPLLKRTAEATDSNSALESVLALLANRPLRSWTDADTERFAAQAQYIGDLWKEHANEQVVAPPLPTAARQRAEAIADELEHFLGRFDEDVGVIDLALRLWQQRSGKR